jgi:two-component system phosphate regulon sensor histidine kinase PhoR
MAQHTAITDRAKWATATQPRMVAALRVAALVPVLVATFAISAARSQDVLGPGLLVASGLVAAATLITLTPAYRRFAPLAMIAIPVLDLSGVLVFHLLPGGAIVGALVAVPALWLGGSYRWRGVVIVATTGAVGLMAEFLTSSSVASDPTLARTATIVGVAVIAAGAMASSVGVWLKQVALLERQTTELATALRDVRQQRSYVDAIVRTVDVGLAFLTTDGQYASLNPRHQELMALAFPHGHTGWVGEAGEIYAADNATPITRDQLPSVRAMQGRNFSDTLWYGEQAATRHAVAVSGRPLLDECGDFAGAVVACHDITPLMRSLAVKDQFVASVSHELRTPLSSIIGYLEMAQDYDEVLPPEVVRHLAVASRNADRLLRLVSDLLTAASPDDVAAQQLLSGLVDVSEMVTVCVDDAARGAERAGVGLSCEIAPGVCVVGDRSRVMQMIENLLSNAVKYTPPGGQVLVGLSQSASNVVLTFQDTGIGVSEEDQEGLFTRFFRARNAHALVIPGVGLGLAVSKEIIEAHNGTIDLASREHHGTTVRVTLPRTTGDIPADPHDSLPVMAADRAS